MSVIYDPKKTVAVIDNLIKSFTTTVNLSPYEGACVKKTDDSLWFYSGSKSLFFNAVYNQESIRENPNHYFSELIDFFSKTNSSFIWWWMRPSPIPENIKNELDNFQFQFLGETVGIAMHLVEIEAKPLPENIRIKEVFDDSDYQEYVDIVSKVNHLAGIIKSDFAVMYQSYGPQSHFKHYLAYFNNKAVGAVSSYLENNTVGIYCAATLPEFQKKGISTALIKHLLSEAKKMGCTVAVTQNTTPSESKGITQKLGFTPCCVLYPYVKIFNPNTIDLFKSA